MTKLLFFSSLFITSLTGYSQIEWTIDKTHSSIRFTTVHMLISEVGGNFKEFKGKVISSSDDFIGSTVEFTANAASINTENERRDNHLRSKDFFNVEKYPELSFKGKIIQEGSSYYLDGDFTMHGTTKSIKFNVKYNGQIPGSRGKKAGFKVTGVVNRFDYGLKWDKTIEAGGLVVSEEITIVCNLELREVIKTDK